MSTAFASHGIPEDTSPSIENLLDEGGRYLPPESLDIIVRAYEVAAEAHAGQMRLSGEPYLTHLVATAYYLAALRLDVSSLVAGLLHDSLEDTLLTYEELERGFGHSVARIVEGVSKFSQIGHRHRVWGEELADVSRRQRTDRSRVQAENVRKMLLAMAEDARVVIVKLADRLHNMRTLDVQSEEKRRRIALDTRELYAPLAGRLGIAQIKWPLEDLAFMYLEPETYQWLSSQLTEQEGSREAYIAETCAAVKQQLEASDIGGEVSGRVKHLFSIYRKLIRPGVDMDLNRVFDFFALRVIVSTVPECYQVLGLIHTMWLPTPARFKDYIGAPKPNGYQSLHTTVHTDGARTTEIQIRTREMHEVAEFGVATHWYYKEQGQSSALPQPLTDWLHALKSWQQDLNPDATEFVDALKTDLFTGQVLVYSPRGDIIDMAAGSTPVDFAYRIHTDLGNRCIGAKVNGMMVPLSYQLQTGDRVAILTTKAAHGPGRDWLSFVGTANARQKIRQWFNKQNREENIARGREMLESELRKLGLGSIGELGESVIASLPEMFGARSLDDVYAQVGYGALSPHRIFNRLGLFQVEYEEIPAESPQPPGTPGEIRVMGVGDLLTRLATDCAPAPGDDIIGYITRNRGVTIHRCDCPRIQAEKETERLVKVDWGPQSDQQLYAVSIEIEAWDREGLLRDIAIALAEERVNMTSAKADSHPDGSATVTAIMRIAGIDQLTRIISRVERIRGVSDVRRQGRARRSRAQTA
jgi:GTP diphosphokinase / guanosine-3',5'-bis(diphosphate) 3'-diphosphatase